METSTIIAPNMRRYEKAREYLDRLVGRSDGRVVSVVICGEVYSYFNLRNELVAKLTKERMSVELTDKIDNNGLVLKNILAGVRRCQN